MQQLLPCQGCIRYCFGVVTCNHSHCCPDLLNLWRQLKSLELDESKRFLTVPEAGTYVLFENCPNKLLIREAYWQLAGLVKPGNPATNMFSTLFGDLAHILTCTLVIILPMADTVSRSQAHLLAVCNAPFCSIDSLQAICESPADGWVCSSAPAHTCLLLESRTDTAVLSRASCRQHSRQASAYAGHWNVRDRQNCWVALPNVAVGKTGQNSLVTL